MNLSTVEIHESAALFRNTSVVGNAPSSLIDRTQAASPSTAALRNGPSTEKQPSKKNSKENNNTEKKKRRKKKWKKPKDKPNRPLSAYNLFFQSERQQMLGDDMPTFAQESLKKRVHCKTHGKIGFAEMARNIGAKWKSLDPAVKQPFLDRAQREKQRYSAELAAWRANQKDGGDDDSTSSTGLEAMATAAMASNPMNSSSNRIGTMGSNKPSGGLMAMVAAGDSHRSNMAMLQGNMIQQQDLEQQLRAMPNTRPDTTHTAILGFPQQREYPVMQYPSEASANVIMNHFQGTMQQVPPAAAQGGGGIQNLYDVDRFSQLMAMRRMQQQRFLASGGQFNNEYGFSIR